MESLCTKNKVLLRGFLAIAAGCLCLCPGWIRADVLEELKGIEAATKNVVQKDSPAVVALTSPTGETGSGVIVSEDGLILTAAHVVEGRDAMTVVFPDGRTAAAKVLGANFSRDAAMVRLTGKGPWPHVELGDSNDLKVGNFVVALGHAKGFDATRRAPVRLGRLHTDGRQRFLISECTLIGGDSGGPLFDLQGRLVGIHSSIGPLLRINNHVPVSAFKDNWDRLAKGDQWGVLGVHPMSDPESPFLGCSVNQITGVEGIVVEDVIPDSPADKAGLKQGDVITRMADRELRRLGDLSRELGRFKPGENVELVVYRRGEPYKANLVFGKIGDLMERYRQTQMEVVE